MDDAPPEFSFRGRFSAPHQSVFTVTIGIAPE